MGEPKTLIKVFAPSELIDCKNLTERFYMERNNSISVTEFSVAWGGEKFGCRNREIWPRKRFLPQPIALVYLSRVLARLNVPTNIFSHSNRHYFSSARFLSGLHSVIRTEIEDWKNWIFDIWHEPEISPITLHFYEPDSLILVRRRFYSSFFSWNYTEKRTQRLSGWCQRSVTLAKEN